MQSNIETKKFCERWDILRDRLMVETGLSFESAEEVLHRFHKIFPEIFLSHFDDPNLLANEIADYIEEVEEK